MSDCIPYPPDMACAPDWITLDPALQNRATVLAWSTIRTLTGGRVGSCEVILRPCIQKPCDECHSVLGYPGMRPSCWTDACSCAPLSEVVMPGPVAEISSVVVDGVILPPASYRLDNKNRLVRTDGGTWPSCQDMSLPDTDPGTFSVFYLPGVPPNSDGLWAAGVLAYEFSQACTGGKCRLPSSVTSIARQGVSMQFDNTMFSNGLTGIREVDAWVLSINPNKLKVPPRVWSPDSAGDRFMDAVL